VDYGVKSDESRSIDMFSSRQSTLWLRSVARDGEAMSSSLDNKAMQNAEETSSYPASANTDNKRKIEPEHSNIDLYST
jgi:hypothetical protein